MKTSKLTFVVIVALIGAFLVCAAGATPVLAKAQMPILNFFGINVQATSAGATSARPTFRAPTLEVFAPDGKAVYYSSDTPTITKTLKSLGSNLASLKPLPGYVPLNKLLGDLQAAGAKNIDIVGKRKVYTLIIVELNGDQCKPCKDVSEALSTFVKENPANDSDILELTLTN